MAEHSFWLQDAGIMNSVLTAAVGCRTEHLGASKNKSRQTPVNFCVLLALIKKNMNSGIEQLGYVFSAVKFLVPCRAVCERLSDGAPEQQKVILAAVGLHCLESVVQWWHSMDVCA